MTPPVPHLKMVLAGLDPGDATICDRLGGRPNQWGEAERWPVCGVCGEPMHFVVQLHGEAGGGRARIGAATCLQLFACHNKGDCGFYDVRSRAHRVALRTLPLAAVLVDRPGGNTSPVVNDPLRVARSIRFTDGADDVDAIADYENDRYEAAHAAGFVDKLYGVPVAANEPDRVTCAACGQPLGFLGQLLSADDWFIYYLHACDHGHEVTFHAHRA